jgi:PilZ domain
MKETGTPAASGELRRSRRLDVSKLVFGEVVPSGAPVKIRDIGFGGFAIETSFSVRVGSVLDFRFTSKDGSTFVLKAGVIHSRLASRPTDPAVYVSGLEFADKATPTDERADLLIGKVNWILAFYDEAWRDSSDRAEPAEPVARASTHRARHRHWGDEPI